MSAMRCPVCRAAVQSGPQCRRCKADLSLLFALEAERDYLLAEASRHAHAGHWREFRSAVVAAHELRADDRSRKLRALAHLLNGDREQALSLALALRG
jgi:hypothetical protein